MERKNSSQLDLFSQGRTSSSEEIPRRSSARLSDIRKYDKILLLGISFIVTVIIAFSLGVEKGKRLTAARFRSGFDAARAGRPVTVPEQPPQAKTITAPAIQQKTMTAPAAPAPVQAQAPVLAAGSAVRSFTIQIGSFKSRAYAQKQLGVLKQKGQPVYLTVKGKYTVLCIGNFRNKETAMPLLSELKKNYQDCFIRRL